MSKLIYNGSIKDINISLFFDRYNVSDKDIEYYTKLVNDGEDQQATDEFIFKYVSNPSELYTRNIQGYMSAAEQGELKKTDKSKIEKFIVGTSLALNTLLLKNVGEYIKKAFSPKIFSDNNITNQKLKDIILDATLSEFNTLTTGAMANTQANILNNIRNMQREMIFFNQNISKIKDLTPEFFNNEVLKFKSNLRKTMPDYYKGMENGQLLITRTFDVNGVPMVRHWKLGPYAEMSCRQTILNVDRISVIESVKFEEGSEGTLVVVYYLRDKSATKTGKRRRVCKLILQTLLFGEPLLALDPETGRLLGIRTVDEAKAEDDKALGIGCHHSVKKANRETRKKVAGLLKKRREEEAL